MSELPNEIYYWELSISDRYSGNVDVSEFVIQANFSNFEAAKTQINIVYEKVCEKFGKMFKFYFYPWSDLKDSYNGSILTERNGVLLGIDLRQKKATIYNTPCKTKF